MTDMITVNNHNTVHVLTLSVSLYMPIELYLSLDNYLAVTSHLHL